MKNENDVQELVNKSLFISFLESFDVGKALVAALSVGILGFLASLFASLFRFVYWSSFFEYFNLPIQYFQHAVDTSISYYGIVVAIPISIVYLVIQIKYNQLIKRCCEVYNRKNKRTVVAIINHWLTRKSVYFLMPLIYLILFFSFLILVEGGNEFIISIFFCSIIFNTILSIICGFISEHRHKDKGIPGQKTIYNRLSGLTVVLVTFFLISLYLIYLFGYFQNIIMIDIPQIISVDNEESSQEYAKILEIDTGYICVPISYEEGMEHIMNVENDTFRIIPKDESVTLSVSDAFVMQREGGTGILFDFIAHNSNLFWIVVVVSALFSIFILTIEWKIFINCKRVK